MPNSTKNKPVQIVVLSDGETFDLLENCEMVSLPDTVDASDTEAVEQFLRNRTSR